jgi:hypothetical protein
MKRSLLFAVTIVPFDFQNFALRRLCVIYITSTAGSVVLPILGAVPDGCIVLFSGMGPNAAEELAVGN